LFKGIVNQFRISTLPCIHSFNPMKSIPKPIRVNSLALINQMWGRWRSPITKSQSFMFFILHLTRSLRRWLWSWNRSPIIPRPIPPAPIISSSIAVRPGPRSWSSSRFSPIPPMRTSFVLFIPISRARTGRIWCTRITMFSASSVPMPSVVSFLVSGSFLVSVSIFSFFPPSWAWI
jgi:hypothetical protein